jgi:ribosomal protein S18 acetylase RimI-like enzyme
VSQLQIIVADLHNPLHGEHIVALLDHYAAHPMGQGRPLDDEIRRSLLPGLQAHPTSLVLLAYRDATPIGAAICFGGFSTFKARPLLNIHDFIIHESARGQGVGKVLLNAVCEEARRRGCCRVTLEVRVTNEPAIELYKRCGFEPGEANSTAEWFFKKEL